MITETPPPKRQDQIGYLEVRSPALTSPSHLARRACIRVAPKAEWDVDRRNLKATYHENLLKKKEGTTGDIIGITIGFPAPLYVASLINRLLTDTQAEANRRTPTGGACWSNCAAAPKKCW